MRADFDTTATARGVVGMIFGMIGLNPAPTATTGQTRALRLMFNGISNDLEQQR
jgi:hypothetical protein